jgi:energy-coupling factor transporter transmembrane protein EcfT
LRIQPRAGIRPKSSRRLRGFDYADLQDAEADGVGAGKRPARTSMCLELFAALFTAILLIAVLFVPIVLVAILFVTVLFVAILFVTVLFVAILFVTVLLVALLALAFLALLLILIAIVVGHDDSSRIEPARLPTQRSRATRVPACFSNPDLDLGGLVRRRVMKSLRENGKTFSFPAPSPVDIFEFLPVSYRHRIC